MRTVSAVIGCNYGDEGKGHIVDYLSKPTSLVVRFNGGSQAGHTVVRMSGSRHVFHHFGSGTLTGAATFLSRFFIANPMSYVEEFRELKRRPRVYIDPRCLVSTPYDMMLNQTIETNRSGERHGSCGMGIHETKVRNEGEYRFDYGFLVRSSRSAIEQKLNSIRKLWAPKRAEELGLKSGALPLLLNDGILEHFLKDIEEMTKTALPVTWSKAAAPYGTDIIFEGAQGLRLDQDAPDFPYVTHSKTGLTNVLTMMEEASIKDKLDVYYVTRPYITRHGAGPLSHETLQLPYMNIRDQTNIENQWQGPLRLGLFDLEEFLPFVVGDLKRAEHRSVEPHLAMTCLDQIERQRIPTIERVVRPDELLDTIASSCNMESCLKGYGPTKNDVSMHRTVWRK